MSEKIVHNKTLKLSNVNDMVTRGTVRRYFKVGRPITSVQKSPRARGPGGMSPGKF